MENIVSYISMGGKKVSIMEIFSLPAFPALSAGEESSYNKENRKLSFPSMAAQEKKKWARPLQWKSRPAFFPFFLHQPAPSKGFLSTKEKNYELCHCPAHQRNL